MLVTRKSDAHGQKRSSSSLRNQKTKYEREKITPIRATSSLGSIDINLPNAKRSSPQSKLPPQSLPERSAHARVELPYISTSYKPRIIQVIHGRSPLFEVEDNDLCSYDIGDIDDSLGYGIRQSHNRDGMSDEDFGFEEYNANIGVSDLDSHVMRGSTKRKFSLETTEAEKKIDEYDNSHPTTPINVIHQTNEELSQSIPTPQQSHSPTNLQSSQKQPNVQFSPINSQYSPRQVHTTLNVHQSQQPVPEIIPLVDTYESMVPLKVIHRNSIHRSSIANLQSSLSNRKDQTVYAPGGVPSRRNSNANITDSVDLSRSANFKKSILDGLLSDLDPWTESFDSLTEANYIRKESSPTEDIAHTIRRTQSMRSTTPSPDKEKLKRAASRTSMSVVSINDNTITSMGGIELPEKVPKMTPMEKHKLKKSFGSMANLKSTDMRKSLKEIRTPSPVSSDSIASKATVSPVVSVSTSQDKSKVVDETLTVVKKPTALPPVAEKEEKLKIVIPEEETSSVSLVVEEVKESTPIRGFQRKSRLKPMTPTTPKVKKKRTPTTPVTPPPTIKEEIPPPVTLSVNTPICGAESDDEEEPVIVVEKKPEQTEEERISTFIEILQTELPDVALDIKEILEEDVIEGEPPRSFDSIVATVWNKIELKKAGRVIDILKYHDMFGFRMNWRLEDMGKLSPSASRKISMFHGQRHL
jgi:hypothetical protein